MLKIILIVFSFAFSFQSSAGDLNLKLDEVPRLKFFELKPFSYYIGLSVKSPEKVVLNSVQISDYQHKQGFFCDFEDRINRKRKLKLDLGITGVQ